MNLSTKNPKVELLLHPRDVLTLNNVHHGMAIECKDGILWVTCSGEYEDHMLRAGRRYISKNTGNVVIEAINEACVDIEEPS